MPFTMQPRVVLIRAVIYLAGSTGVLAHNPARLLRGLTSSGLWAASVCTMAGILPQCTAREAVQSSKPWVPALYSTDHSCKKANPEFGDPFLLLNSFAIHRAIRYCSSQSHRISQYWKGHDRREPPSNENVAVRGPDNPCSH